MTNAKPLIRSLLFVPANRAEMVFKAVAFGSDVVVVDLEDAVSASDKSSARQTAVGAVSSMPAALRETCYLRVNPADTSWFCDDVTAVVTGGFGGVVLPKLATQAEIAELRQQFLAHGVAEVSIIGGLESAQGVADSRLLLATGLYAAYFGAEDFIADMGGRRSKDGAEVLYARSKVALAGRLTGVPVIDQAVVGVREDAQFRADAEQGRNLGYAGKICIHPRQVELAHQIFAPTADEIAYARRVLEVGADGVTTLDGQMIDAVHLRAARVLLERAGLLVNDE